MDNFFHFRMVYGPQRSGAGPGRPSLLGGVRSRPGGRLRGVVTHGPAHMQARSARTGTPWRTQTRMIRIIRWVRAAVRSCARPGSTGEIDSSRPAGSVTTPRACRRAGRDRDRRGRLGGLQARCAVLRHPRRRCSGRPELSGHWTRRSRRGADIALPAGTRCSVCRLVGIGHSVGGLVVSAPDAGSGTVVSMCSQQVLRLLVLHERGLRVRTGLSGDGLPASALPDATIASGDPPVR